MLLGPAHRVAVRGTAAPNTDGFSTPLGLVPVDVAGREALVGAGLVVVRDDVHAAEHSLEVQLPCLQARWARCRSFPSPWATPTRPWWPRYWMQSGAATETLVVVSSDLSHYLDRASATEVDQRTAAAIVAREPHRLGPYDACGVRPVQGLLTAALRHGLHVDLLDLRRSADTAGDHERVVGYGAFALA